MQRAKRQRWWRRPLSAAQGIGLFALFYAYVLLGVRPELFYVQDPVVFLVDGHFFANWMDRPGGPVAYASAFLSACLASGWIGALVITSLVALVCLATGRLFVAIAGAGDRIVLLIPAVLVLLLLGQYVSPVRVCVGLVVALLFANVYVRMGGRPAAVRLVAFLVASGLVYAVAAGPYLVFAAVCGVYELGVKRSLALGVLCALCAVLVPMAGAPLFDLTPSQAYAGLMAPSVQHWLAMPASVPLVVAIQAGLVLFFPVAAAVLIVYGRRRGGLRVAEAANRTVGQREAGDARSSRRAASARRLALTWAGLVVGVVVLDLVSSDFPKHCLLRMVRSAQRRQWDAVLAHVRRVPVSDMRRFDVRTGYHVNRALYHKGRLLDRMFSHPQGLNAPTLALVAGDVTTMARTTPRQSSEIFFELGRVNESEHMAYEALEVFGDRPRTLKRLAYINVLQGRPEAARRFLAVLERSLLHARWARRCARRLDADPTLSDVPVVASLRESMVVRDSINEVEDLEAMLQGLLERNPRNRMALEYLMAHYLLTRRLEPLVANLHRFENFGDPRLPLHCKEALAVYLADARSADARSADPDPGGGRIRPETARRYENFMRAVRQFPNRKPRDTYAALYDAFGDTYFFFYLFGRNDPPPESSP